ncbi:hypothetical protein L195_g059722, partial [Trifolium pratense]
ALAQPEAPAKLAAPAQKSTIESFVHTEAPAKPATLAQPATSAHSSTPEVFMFMPTPGMGIQTMVGSSQCASREAPIEENNVQQISDEEVVGQGNVLPFVHMTDENGKIIIRPLGKG